MRRIRPRTEVFGVSSLRYRFVPDCAQIPYHVPDGLASIYREEGLAGLYRGTSLALFGVSNGAIQFMAYEEMKRWGFERKKRQFAKAGREYTPADDKLVCTLSTISGRSLN